MADRPIVVAGVMLLGGAFALFLVLALAAWIWEGRTGSVPRTPVRRAAPTGGRARRSALPAAQAQRTAEAVRREWQRLTAYASAAGERAVAARAEAAEAQERSAAAEALRDVAWHEYETAESPLVSVAAPAAKEPERQGLAHAAFVAFRRGAISVRELQRVWSNGSTTDPEQEERRRAAATRTAREREARTAYQRAAATARLAQEQAQVAEVAAQALTAEAAEAEREARDAEAVVQRYWQRPQ
jgi:hypothetical protein